MWPGEGGVHLLLGRGRGIMLEGQMQHKDSAGNVVGALARAGGGGVEGTRGSNNDGGGDKGFQQ